MLIRGVLVFDRCHRGEVCLHFSDNNVIPPSSLFLPGYIEDSGRYRHWLGPDKGNQIAYGWRIDCYLLYQELVRLHGGTISVHSTTVTESTDGSHGTIFPVTIPRGKDHIPSAH